MHRTMKLLTIALLLLLLPGCASLVVGTVTTVAVETAKVPFRVAGAAVDLASDEDGHDED